MSVLDEMKDATARVGAAVAPSVVRVGSEGGRGGGVVIGAGLVLTSAHNLRGAEIGLTFDGGRTEVGTLKAVDPDGDLAVVAADTGAAPAVAWAPAGPATIGTAVFAVVLPPGSTGVRVTSGQVSSVERAFRGPRGRLIADGIEHTAPLGRGSSGGPLVDAEGRMVGINTHRPGDGFYLALPATDELRARVDALAAGTAPTRRRLGIAITPPHAAQRLRAAVGLEPRDGVLVRDVDPDSPAAAAGLRRGDLIVTAGGRAVAGPDDLLGAVDAVEADGRLTLKVLRGSEETDVEVHFVAETSS